MDLASFDTSAAAEQGATLHLRHPTTDAPLHTEDGKPVTITLLGRDSKAWQAHQRAATDRTLGRAGRRAKALTAEQIEADAITGLAALTTGWENVTFKGAPLAFTKANAETLYRTLPWVREQADAFVEDRANFLKA